MKKYKGFFLICSIIICILISVVLISRYYENKLAQSMVDKENMEDFAKNVIYYYNEQVEQNFQKRYRTYFEYYNNTYTINGYISNKKGCAVEILPTKYNRINIMTVNGTIENSIFSYQNLNIYNVNINATVLINNSTGHMLDIGNSKNITISNIIFITNKGYFINIDEQGSLLLINDYVNNKYVYIMFIKGANNKGSWSIEKAKQDAELLFNYDLRNAFASSSEIRKYIAYPVLEKLINTMLLKQQNQDVFNCSVDLVKIR